MVRTVYAPAKINLYLEVCGRRADSYHELGMVMQRISLCDRLELTIGGAPGVRVTCPGLELVAGEENIAARAARAMVSRLSQPIGIDIAIEKQIPAAAGLGGGSSDAAAVLLALNDLLGLGLEPHALMGEGVKLGADVPFFIFGQSAWATGIGERLAPFPLPPFWCVLVNPPLAVSTAWVYQNLRLTSPGEPAKMPRFPRTTAELVALLRNDLERVTVARYPLLAEIKEALRAGGAIGTLMSGSGPTVFGLFAQEATARSAAESLGRAHPAWRIFVTYPL
ncbi:MAG: 4-(cytidine 5'-diphospho)-2-C-methyl-D-erythritol kinase [Desulfuromonadales bacterium]|nr:4-(cytidine 5'-diphospho)-2-C-methyl-D-erythritol kinase [Desulfuromonadales bacterium]